MSTYRIVVRTRDLNGYTIEGYAMYVEAETRRAVRRARYESDAVEVDIIEIRPARA